MDVNSGRFPWGNFSLYSSSLPVWSQQCITASGSATHKQKRAYINISMQEGHNWKTQCCKVTANEEPNAVRSQLLSHEYFNAFRILADKFFRFFPPSTFFRIKVGFQHEIYTETSPRAYRNWNSKSTKIFGLKVLTYSTGFFSYDLAALGFSALTFLRGGIEML